MTKLTVEPWGTGLVFYPPAPFSSTEAYEAWELIVRRFLSYALLDRPAWLVTAQPQKWSFVRELTNEPEISVGGTPYLLAYNAACSVAFLSDVTESEDFNRGLLWFVPLDGGGRGVALNLIRSMQASAASGVQPQLEAELLRCNNDGDAVYWFNPFHSLPKVLNHLSELASFVNWSVDMAAIEAAVSKP